MENMITRRRGTHGEQEHMKKRNTRGTETYRGQEHMDHMNTWRTGKQGEHKHMKKRNT